jgi:hypothetical protein
MIAQLTLNVGVQVLPGRDPAETTVKLVQAPCQSGFDPQNRVGVHALSPSRNWVPERCHRLAA